MNRSTAAVPSGWHRAVPPEDGMSLSDHLHEPKGM
jgi:hypothetical protein